MAQVKLTTRITRIVTHAATMTEATIKADQELRAVCAACAASNSVEPLQALTDALNASDKVGAGTIAAIASHVKHRLLVNVNQNKDGEWQIRANKQVALEANHADAPALGERAPRGAVAPTKSPVMADDLARLVARATKATKTQAAGGFYWKDSQGNAKKHSDDRAKLIAEKLEELAKIMASPK